MSDSGPNSTRVAACAACLVLAFAGAPAGAQKPWLPEKAVEISANCAPGCGPDRTARLLQKLWQENRVIGVPVTAGNRVGGGGAVLYSYLNQRTDGHAVAIASGSLVTNNIVGRGPHFGELTPLARLFGEYITVAVKAASPVKNGREVIEILKKDPQALSVGIATSLGNANHQGVASALKIAGIDVRKARNVVFQSGALAITALLGGHVDLVPGSVSLLLPRVLEGSVRLVAVAAPQRLPGGMAEVPTWREQGVNAVVSNWRGVVGPRGMSAEQIAFWEGALVKATATEEWKEAGRKLLLSDEFLGSADFRRYLDEQYAEVKALLAALELAR
ncbi:MAG: tripartite tricarboxylate transporter substrate binding protein [Burkholderiales bacterium]|nr:tripartite tricarboxylate transporter substrate binding protein [Burkholderiales bacterium]